MYLLVLSFFVISPEENVDMETGARSYTAFRRAARNLYEAKDDAYVMFGKEWRGLARGWRTGIYSEQPVPLFPKR